MALIRLTLKSTDTGENNRENLYLEADLPGLAQPKIQRINRTCQMLLQPEQAQVRCRQERLSNSLGQNRVHFPT